MDQGKIIRFCLVGLPVGILIFGAGTVTFTHFIRPMLKEREIRQHTTELQSRAQRPVSQEELAKHVSAFTEVIGPRSLEEPENLKMAAAYLESTLGPNNLGYPVQRGAFVREGRELRNVWMTVPGRSESTVVVMAPYGAGESAATGDGTPSASALLSLAARFAGTEPESAIRFVAVPRPLSGIENAQDWPGLGDAIQGGASVVIYFNLGTSAIPGAEDDPGTPVPLKLQFTKGKGEALAKRLEKQTLGFGRSLSLEDQPVPPIPTGTPVLWMEVASGAEGDETVPAGMTLGQLYQVTEALAGFVKSLSDAE